MKMQFMTEKFERTWNGLKIASVVSSVCFLAGVYETNGGLFRNRNAKSEEGAVDPSMVVTINDKNASEEFGQGEYKRELTHGDRSRYYLIHVPASYKKGQPVPLVMVFHGGAGAPDHMQQQCKMDQMADANGFIVVYPAGTGMPLTPFLTWNIVTGDTYATAHKIDDIGFVRAIIADMSKLFSIDQKRIYASGLSQGAMLCYQLACKLSDKIAAIAPVGAVITFPETDCNASRPVPVIQFQGLLDPQVSYYGGLMDSTRYDRIPRISVDENIRFWVNQNKLSLKPAKEGVKGMAEFKQYGSETNGPEVILWTLKDGGHTWPGGKEMSLSKRSVGNVNRDVDASAVMWEFFKRHPMP
jgi:polyhydroxybutyrate depolymerase